MIRNLRALALAMGAVFLLGGLMASSASATSIWFEGEAGIQTVTAEQAPNTTDKFVITADDGNANTPSRTTTCEHAHYTNETATVDSTESEIEVTPTYSSCTLHPFGTAHVRVNGCDYRFYNPTTNAEGKRTANVAITCPTGKVIEVEGTVFGTVKCTVTVGPQTPGGHVIFTNTGAGTGRDVTAEATLSGIHYTEHAGTGFEACLNGTGTDGTYTGTSIIRGRDHAGNAKGVWTDV